MAFYPVARLRHPSKLIEQDQVALENQTNVALPELIRGDQIRLK